METCKGTRRDSEPRTASAIPGSRYCWHHNPDHAEKRRRNASRAETLGNSKIGAEIRNTRLMVRDLLEVTISGDLDPLVRKRLAEVVQLVQSYCRLAELEIPAGERPKAGDVALPEDMLERAKGWAEDEEAEAKKSKEMADELSRAMQAHGHDPTPIREAMGG
jgi:hypothetical protein